MPKVLRIKRAAPPLAGKILRVVRERKAVSEDKGTRAPVILTGPALLLGKSVFFESKGEKIAGKVARVSGEKLIVNLAVPGADGLLMVSDTELSVKADDIEVADALTAAKRMRAFEVNVPVTMAKDAKLITIYDQDDDGKATGTVCDYQNVVIEGAASTFSGPEQRDREGDYVLPGAFDATIQDFMRNPVMLQNHTNKVQELAGSFERVSVTGGALGVRANVSNAPGLIDTRFKIVEGHLRAFSIGGIWYYGQDGFGIEEATLYEISIVPVPMNPNALFQTRGLTQADCRKAFKKFWGARKSLKAA